MDYQVDPSVLLKALRRLRGCLRTVHHLPSGHHPAKDAGRAAVAAVVTQWGMSSCDSMSMVDESMWSDKAWSSPNESTQEVRKIGGLMVSHWVVARITGNNVTDNGCEMAHAGQ